MRMLTPRLLPLLLTLAITSCTDATPPKWPEGAASADKAEIDSGPATKADAPPENSHAQKAQEPGPPQGATSDGSQHSQRYAPGEVPVGGRPGELGFKGQGPPLPEAQGNIVMPTVSPEVQEALDKGLAQIRAGDRDGAFKTYSELIEAHPEAFEPYDHRSMIHYNRKAYEEVVSDCTKAIDIARAGGFFPIACPDRCLTRRGASYLNLSQWDKALVDFNEVMTYRPEDGFLYFERGRALHGLGQLEAAKADFEMALKLAPDHEVVADHAPYFLKKIADPNFH